MKTIIKLSVLSFALLSAGAFAQQSSNVIYAGGGSSANTSIYDTKEKPFSVGYLKLFNENSAVIGFDIAREGTKLDSTWGQHNAITSGYSFNMLLGSNLSRSEAFRVDFAFLLGARTTSASCPSSYLGYQCYADTQPDVKYAFNYGTVLAMSFNNLMIGSRITSESRQLILGLRF